MNTRIKNRRRLLVVPLLLIAIAFLCWGPWSRRNSNAAKEEITGTIAKDEEWAVLPTPHQYAGSDVGLPTNYDNDESNSQGWTRVGDLKYKYVTRDDLPHIAIDMARRVFENDPLSEQLQRAEAGGPIYVRDECNGYDYDIVPLTVSGIFAGIVTLVHDEGSTVESGAIAPFDIESAVSQGLNVSDARFPPISFSDAQALVLDRGKELKFEGVVHPCAGQFPLSPPTAPFYSFVIDGQRILVSVVDGSVADEDDVSAFELENQRLWQDTPAHQ